MKKVALIFVLAVIVPSLVLAWLAVRSLRDQQFLLERQQSLLYQTLADARAKAVQDDLAGCQREFSFELAKLLGNRPALEAAMTFDDLLRKNWPLTQVGFVVTLSGNILSPLPYGRPEARAFCSDHSRFLASRESAEVYYNQKQVLNAPAPAEAQQATLPAPLGEANTSLERRYQAGRNAELRNVMPQQQIRTSKGPADEPQLQQQPSRLTAAEAEFRQLIGEGSEGELARFVDNKLSLLLWCRPAQDTNLVFGAQLALPRLIERLRPLLQDLAPELRQEICVALLDDNARPVALSHPEFHATWKRPFVATEIGEVLPHWEIAVYLLDPAKLTRSAEVIKLTLGLLIALLVLAIGAGSWLIVTDLNRQLTLARQKTTFVSNVSHELKTPLTSIRMFSELLAEGRVPDAAKQRAYLGIITAETARLTRLINNVLDFARMERGEKKYRFQKCDLVELARDTAETYRPHLESNGFRFDCRFPDEAVWINGDRDALAQVLVNLLSNAEKYSGEDKDVALCLQRRSAPLPHVEVAVLDRGLGVPKGCQEKIFEQFYRAHDSLSSGIQGSGLGLTLARQIARAHGGDVFYESREGGGSKFSLRLPVLAEANLENAWPERLGAERTEL